MYTNKSTHYHHEAVYLSFKKEKQLEYDRAYFARNTKDGDTY